jgi:protein required for attachment to host cells
MTARATSIERHTTWVLALDGQRAHLFSFTDADATLVPIEGWLSGDAERHAGEDAAHRIAGDHPHSGHARHAKNPKADPHFRRKEDFIKAVAGHINHACATNAFDSLVIAAPPAALGELRHDLSAQVHKRIKSELHQDLTKIPDHELPKHLAKDLPVGLHTPKR